MPGWVLSLRGVLMMRPDHAWIFFHRAAVARIGNVDTAAAGGLTRGHCFGTIARAVNFPARWCRQHRMEFDEKFRCFGGRADGALGHGGACIGQRLPQGSRRGRRGWSLMPAIMACSAPRPAALSDATTRTSTRAHSRIGQTPIDSEMTPAPNWVPARVWWPALVQSAIE